MNGYEFRVWSLGFRGWRSGLGSIWLMVLQRDASQKNHVCIIYIC